MIYDLTPTDDSWGGGGGGGGEREQISLYKLVLGRFWGTGCFFFF